MFIKSLTAVEKDVFLGAKGWSNWVRFKKVNGKWTQTHGHKVDEKTKGAIVFKIESWNKRS